MNVLVLGREDQLVRASVAMLRKQGYHAVGVTRDEEAITHLGSGEFTALLIGSGVERTSRGPLTRHAAAHHTTVIEAHREPMQSLHDHLRETVIPHLQLLTAPA